ncbi:UNVERIFIED_CONTAM: hypothetical protein Slati_4207800 [Sesamum latifolium]|uniref:Transposase-associated domain-containing protein n=1 Tax=Sesamum latifolium TaxID=2727402 RepID=A0AAW2TBG5_9LAMI
MYEKNLPNRVGLTPEFEDGFTAFIEWVKSQHAYMEGEKIRCPCRKCKNKVFKTPDEDEQTPPAPAEEGTSTHCGDVAQMNWAQRMIFYAAGPAFWSSTYNQDGVPDDDRFHDVVHAAEQPLWNRCTQSQLGANDILPRDHTFPLDYYNTKKLIKDLSELMEKIDACRNDCMLYWKDDIDLDYCKLCRKARYQPTRERNPNRKKTPYAILRYLPLTPRLQRLYASLDG